MDTEQEPLNNLPFQTPRKFSSNFEKLVREKNKKKTLTKTKNRFQVLTEDSDSEYEDDLDRVVKRKRVSTPREKTKSSEKSEKEHQETIESILAANKVKNSNKSLVAHKNKNTMPPIIIEGKQQVKIL